MVGPLRTSILRDSGVLIELAAADAMERAASRTGEPVTPAGDARHLSAPVTASNASGAHQGDGASVSLTDPK